MKQQEASRYEGAPPAAVGSTGRCAAKLARFAVLVMLIGSAIPAWAHERRAIGPNGQYTMVVGFRNEPVFEDEMNAVDIIVSRSSDQRPINSQSGDVVNLTVEVQVRAAEAFDSAVVRWADLAAPTQAFETPNRYNSWFRPSEEGTYAFRIRGVLEDASAPLAGRLQIDETFVCGRGSRATQGAFNCVRTPQVFPNRGNGSSRRASADGMSPAAASYTDAVWATPVILRRRVQ